MIKKAVYWLVTEYLKWLAKLQLLKQKTIIIGITGSVGKTSMMKAVEAVLKDKYKVKISEKANSEVGIPLNILGFKGRNYSYADWFWIIPMALIKLVINWEKYDVYVAEMGVDSPTPPKNMEFLLKIIRPKIGIFLNALAVHTENYEHLKGDLVDRVAEEKGKLIVGLPKDGWAILNKNDKRVVSFKDKTKAQVIEVSGDDFEAAIAIAEILNIDRKQAQEKLNKNFKLPPGRMSVIPGIKKTTLMDSSYNASTAPMIRGLSKLSLAKTKKIAVLGDMREMGREAKKEHELVAEKAVKSTDKIVLIGPLMRQYFLPKALKSGFDKDKIFWFDNTYKAADELKNHIVEGGETILIKGSQNSLYLEIITETLMKDKSQAGKLLCRRGQFWDRRRIQLKLLK